MGLLPEITFRSPLLSLFQSAVGDLVRGKLGALAAAPGMKNDLMAAATHIAALQDAGQMVPDVAPPACVQGAWTAAKLGLELMQARAGGDAAHAQSIEDELKGGAFDPGWVECIARNLAFFGPDGTAGHVAGYVRASDTMPVLELPIPSTVALIADWGTGTAAAIDVLTEVAALQPDVLIHLGDIYYSGTPAECEANFRGIVDKVLDRVTKKIPVFNMPGNHDMYSGGAGYYGLLKTLNPPPLQPQPASFFCLRSGERNWQFVAMDTGLHDFRPLNVQTVLTFLEKDEEDWLTARIAEFPGRTILLSHHQLFSAFAEIGPPAADGRLTAYNPLLAASFQRFAAAAQKPIAAWIWGHEHAFTVYDEYRGLAKGRCIGHGAIPVLASADYGKPNPRIADPPPFRPIALAKDDKVYAHGFATIRFAADGSALAAYYQQGSVAPIFSEPL